MGLTCNTPAGGGSFSGALGHNDTISFASGTNPLVYMTDIDYDNGGYFQVVLGTNQLVIPSTGVYQISLAIVGAINPSDLQGGDCGAVILKNSVWINIGVSLFSTWQIFGDAFGGVSEPAVFGVGDTVDVQLRGQANTIQAITMKVRLAIERLSDYPP